MAEQEALEAPAVPEVDFLWDTVEPVQCLERAAVTAQEEEAVVLAVVVQVLVEEQEEVLEVPWEHPFWNASLHPRGGSWSTCSLPLPFRTKQVGRLLQSTHVLALPSSSTSTALAKFLSSLWTMCSPSFASICCKASISRVLARSKVSSSSYILQTTTVSILFSSNKVMIDSKS